MGLTEIKELYAEEMTLLKRIQKYGKEYPLVKMERVEKVKLILLYRIFSNLHSANILTSFALKRNIFLSTSNRSLT